MLLEDELATERLGQHLAETLPVPSVVALCGTLGAGKTRLVRSLASARGVPEDQVLSPTFTLCNEYQGDAPIYHLDFYRIGDEDELIEIGWEEYLPRGLVLIEWADRFKASIPVDALWIHLEVHGEIRRRVTFVGPPWLLKRIRDRCP